MIILVANAGSTSLKFKLYEMPEKKVLCTGKVERVGSDDALFAFENRLTGEKDARSRCRVPDYTAGIRMFLDAMCNAGTGRPAGVLADIREVGAVGFKTVAAKGYYGVHFLTEEVLAAMEAYRTVAPAHNTAYIEAIRCFRAILPDTPFVGVFETAFHQTIPEKRYLYSIPYEWSEKYGIRKLGYHGASHSYAAYVLTELYGTTGKAVTCHLGGSGSLCAVEDGRSVDTSFGMSLQTGLMQNNRTGDLDPYVIRHLLAQGLEAEEIFEALHTKSGFLGVSGAGRDLRYLTEAAEAGNTRAALAIEMFTESILRYIGAYAAEMGGLDNIVFTGGIGENAGEIREAVCRKLAFLGLVFDEEANAAVPDREGGRFGEHVITKPESLVRVIVLPADEEIVVAEKTYKMLL